MEDIFLYTVKMKGPILRIIINFHHIYVDVERTLLGLFKNRIERPET